MRTPDYARGNSLMADGCYNHIYSVLVENEQDTLGIIAYSLYKRQKI